MWTTVPLSLVTFLLGFGFYATVDVPAWQIVLPLSMLAVSIVGTLRIAGLIYRSSLLRTGTRVTFTEAWKNRHDPSL